MRAEKNERVRRRLLQEAVADNVDTIRGLPPRALWPRKRFLRTWARRGSLLLVPLTLAASTYLVTTPATVNSAPAPLITPAVHAASIIPPVKIPTIRMPDMQRVAVEALPLAVKRVVLDAGHGGTDPGAVSLGVTEKEVTLDIGKRLTLLLEAGGFDVVTTRNEDATLALRERARLANESRSDVFVSIHVNTIEKHVSSRGVETYYLGATNDPKLTQLAAAENYESGYTMADLRHLLDGIYADARRDESRQLAAVVQRHLYERLKGSDDGLENWGVKRAPFIVLVATEMPAILAEVGCISNKKEAAMLGRAEYRQKIAEALYDGIRAYAGASDAPQKKGT